MSVYQKHSKNPIPLNDKARSQLGIYAPIHFVRLWHSSLEFIRVNDATAGGNAGGGIREAIREFTRQSRMRYLHKVVNSPHAIDWMLTLTYPREFPTDGRVVKRQLNRLFMWMKKWLRTVYDLGFEYVWRLEFQRRGSPHLHVYLSADFEGLGYEITTAKRPNPRRHQTERYETIKPIERKIRRQWLSIIDDPISGLWGGLTAEDYTRKERAHFVEAGDCLEKLRDGAAYAVSKEMAHSKEYQNRAPDDFENVGRWWGCSRGFGQSENDCDIYEITTPQAEAMLQLLDWKWLRKFDFIPKFVYGFAPKVREFFDNFDCISIPLAKAKEAVRSIFQRNLKGIKHVSDFDRSVIAAKITNKELHIHQRQRHNVYANMPRLPRRALRPQPNAPPEDKQLSLF